MDEYFRQWVWYPNEESNRFWRAWIEKHPDKSAEVEEAIGLLKKLRLSEYTLTEAEVALIWKRIKNTSNPAQGGPYQPKIPRWWLSAAAVFVLAAISFLIYLINTSSESLIIQETAYGETRTILLPDSSKVILNANSKISYTNNWDKIGKREVHLEGEAFFDVVHTVSDQPFQVKVSNGLAVEVLGTSFNVYHRKADTKVVLNTGKITLTYPEAKQEKKITMKPGELVEYRKDRISKREVDPEHYASWTENKIILNQTSLQEMIQKAKDNYGIEILVASEKMLTQTVSGSMPIGDADSFAGQIATVFHLKITRTNDKYLLQE